MKRISITFYLCLLLSMLSSCYKDYSCKCISVYDVTMGTKTGTDIYPLQETSRTKADETCKSYGGPFSYPDFATGLDVTGIKTCELE